MFKNKYINYILTMNNSEKNRCKTSEHYKTATVSKHLPACVWILATQLDKNQTQE
jgi:hypothetical protein